MCNEILYEIYDKIYLNTIDYYGELIPPRAEYHFGISPFAKTLLCLFFLSIPIPYTWKPFRGCSKG